MNDQTRPHPPASQARTAPPKKISLGALGCLGIVGIFVLAVIGGVIVDKLGPAITITGDSGAMRYKVNSFDTAQLAGNSVAERVYSAASKYPLLKKITVDLELDVPGGVVDRYGKTVEGPLNMGTIVVSDLEEVRRHTDKSAYARKIEAVFGVQISMMSYSHLLSK